MLKDIIEELKPTLKKLGTPVQLSSNPDSSDGLIFYEDDVEKIVAETAQIVAREVRDSLVKVVDDYEKDITKLHHRMMGTAHDDCKEMLAFDMHSRLIAIKHIKEKLDKEFTHLQSLEEELTK